ncbi:6-pyruvoyl trahydropterin synthase family protein [Xanthovirga aplysinae]|uniref:6-pyruvoyl trahydropterin synthase family protein n=1 Tax=Xanthovirga aplysinae TaxID=2529853 RepID=UPI0012BD531C|nr:6-carboxytetrahydropterin synthase [Xanthovirga aplysinae]MTI30215.1 6-carboxytetrahydropterin synthase [Xanthovirga aplysinae]
MHFFDHQIGKEKKIKITKIFNFEMSHALPGYDGDCKNIHGHSFVLHITLRGKVFREKGHPKDGMVLDYKVLKNMVKEQILSKFDHALVLSTQTDQELIQILKTAKQKLHLVPFQTTSENLLFHFVELLAPHLPDSVELYSIKLFETNSSYAEWALDNQ